MASSVTARAPAWADGVAVSGAEMRSAVNGALWATAGFVNGLRPVQIPTPAMQIRVPAGRCIVSDGAGGMIPLELQAQTDLDIAASSPTQARIDSLIAEFVDNGGSSLYRFRVITGTPSGSPVAPSLPPGDQPTAKTLRLANIAVAANATTIVNANISLQAGMALSSVYNGVPLTANDGARPTEVDTAALRWRSDKKCFDIWFGSQWGDLYAGLFGPPWTSYTPSLTGTTTNPTLGTGSSRTGAWQRDGRRVTVRANIKFGTSGAAAGSGFYEISLPFNAKVLSTGRQAAGAAYTYDSSGNDFEDGVAFIDTSVADRVRLSIAGGVITNSFPWTWAVSDELGFTITYEADS